MVDNYRQITLLNTIYKLYSKVINNRLYKFLEDNKCISDCQNGFRKYRNCSLKIQTLRNIIEDALGHKRSLYVLTIDFEKAFDSICHQALIEALRTLSVSNKIISIIEHLYKDAHSDVITGQGITAAIKILRGVRQGDVLSPLLFNVFMECLTKRLQDSNLGYKFSANQVLTVSLLLFADDMALAADNIQELQSMIDIILEDMVNTGLKINTSKTILAVNKFANQTCSVLINGTSITPIGQNDTFKYLGVLVNMNGSNKPHCNYVCDKATKRALKLTRIKLPVVQAVTAINTIIIPTITYGAESLPWNNAQLKKLDSTIASIYMALTKINRVNISRVFLFSKQQQGGLGITQPSNTIRSNMISRLHYLLNCKTDSQCHRSTLVRIHDIRKHSNALRSPIGTKHWVTRYRVRSYLNIVNDALINNCIAIEQDPNSKVSKNNVYTGSMDNSGDNITLYTDGSYDKKKKIAAYAVINHNNHTVYENGRIPGIQNNYRAELYGILRALNNTKSNQSVTVYTDSLSCIDAIETFSRLTHNEKRIKFMDKDVVNSIVQEMKRVSKCQLQWVPSHSGIPSNELADKLAKKALHFKRIKKIPICTNDEYKIVFNNESPRGNPNEFIMDILTANYITNTNSSHMVNNEIYHSATQIRASEPSNIQVFLVRLRANQLATKSKMSKWSNGEENPCCPRCFTETENQNHLLLECMENDSYIQALTKNLKHCIVSNLLDPSTRYKKDVRIPGTHVYMNQYNQYTKYKEHKNHKIYAERMGLITWKTAKYLTNNIITKKPSQVIAKIINILHKFSYDLWTDRCVANSVVPKTT